MTVCTVVREAAAPSTTRSKEVGRETARLPERAARCRRSRGVSYAPVIVRWWIHPRVCGECAWRRSKLIERASTRGPRPRRTRCAVCSAVLCVHTPVVTRIYRLYQPPLVSRGLGGLCEPQGLSAGPRA